MQDVRQFVMMKFRGLTKFMALYGMSSDTASGLVLARRAMGLSESVPAHIALPAGKGSQETRLGFMVPTQQKAQVGTSS